MAHFLRLTNLNLGLHTLTLDYKTQHIDPTIPPYHRELLIAWNKCDPSREKGAYGFHQKP